MFLRDWEAKLVRKDNRALRYIGYSAFPILSSQGDLANILLQMVDITERAKAEEALREREESLKRAQEMAQLGSWELDLVADRLTWSDEVYRIFGLRPQQFGATYEAFLRNIHPEDREAVNEAYAGSLREGRDSYEIEHRVVRRDTGEIRYVHEKCRHIRDQQGLIIRSQGMVHDITERKKDEESLRRYAEEVVASNREMESFSYSVSHDLRAPLRTMSSFSEFVLEDYGSKLDDTGRDYLKRIVAGADKMNTLIDDMLSLSRISRQEMSVREVDLSALGRMVIEELSELESERHVEAIVHDNLKAGGDTRLLRIALTNLLGNAWKYTAKTVEPRIEFGSYRREGETVFFVRDNGAGFPPAQADKLFRAFQRLHSEGEFPGNGIGLPIVERVINRHGGRIWAEGEVAKGATFYFTLQPGLGLTPGH